MAHASTDATFESDVLSCDLPVLVDFWAPWCGPCKAMAPVLDEVANAYAGRLKVVKHNVDENPAQATKYGIRAIPTLVLFKNGKPVEQSTGALSKGSLSELLDKSIN